MASTRQAGAGMLLPPIFPTYNRLQQLQSAQAVGPLTLAAGQAELIPAGQWLIQPGPYSQIEVYDPITGIWRGLGTQAHDMKCVLSDGQNFRISNLSGCAVGAFVTNVGSGYTSAPTVTASAGGSAWRAIVGGAINTTVTITSGGSGYTYPPLLLIDPPPVGGVVATATCTISAGAINAVTVVNQGAGYLVAPNITILPDPRDTAGTGGVLTVNSTLAGAGTVTAVVCTDQGTPQTSVPTLSFSGGGGSSAAATAVMCFAVTGFTITTPGAAYGNAQPFVILTGGGIVGGSAGAVVNPALGPGRFTPRQANITGVSNAGGVPLTAGAVVNDGGLFQAVPTGFVLAGNAVPTTQMQPAMTVGGVTDTSFIYSA